MNKLIRAIARALGCSRNYAVIAVLLDDADDYRIVRHFVGAAPWLSAGGYNSLPDWVARAHAVAPEKVQILSVCEVKR